MTTNSPTPFNNTDGILYMSLELSASTWKLGFAERLGRKVRIRSVPAGDLQQLEREIGSAKRVFELAPECATVSCYEAGRDGFWIHRCLVALGIDSHIVDAASIQVNRKKRRAKTDRIDAQMIVMALIRYQADDHFACRMIRIPSVESEDERQLNREMVTIRDERTKHTNRIKSLLVTQGIVFPAIDRDFPNHLESEQTAAGKPLGSQLKQRLLREFERLKLATEQMRTLQMQQARMIRDAAKAIAGTTRKKKVTLHDSAMTAERLIQLSGIGPVTSWTLSTEIFSWRDITNRRQLGAFVGLTPTPHHSGDEEKDQGISKSGRGDLRVLMIEIAWGWLIHQPESELTKWYKRRFDDGTKRNRKIGIVALARKLLVALGKFVRHGEIPTGARLTEKQAFSYVSSLTQPT